MRSEVRHDSKLFRELSRSLLKQGISIRFLVQGRSMFPAIANGETVEVESRKVRRGDVLLLETDDGLRVHRLQGPVDDKIVTRGDSCFESETAHADAVYGRVSTVIGPNGSRSPGRLAQFVRRFCRLFGF